MQKEVWQDFVQLHIYTLFLFIHPERLTAFYAVFEYVHSWNDVKYILGDWCEIKINVCLWYKYLVFIWHGLSFQLYKIVSVKQSNVDPRFPTKKETTVCYSKCVKMVNVYIFQWRQFIFWVLTYLHQTWYIYYQTDIHKIIYKPAQSD